MNLTQYQINTAKKICKKYGTSYFLATKFLNQEQKYATWIIYAFVRLADEIVDTEKLSDIDKKNKIKEFKNNWLNIYNSENYDFKEDEINNLNLEILKATRIVFEYYNIPLEYSLSFLEAMEQDTEEREYANFEELEKYMYGSASCVGLIMTYIIGLNKNKILQESRTESEILKYASYLGIAMQLTNFLRDIDEDITQRDRVYLPQENLKRFNLTSEDIKNKIYNENFINLIKYETEIARNYYRLADIGIKYLDKSGSLGVKISSKLYEKILDKIEQKNYNIWNKRVRTTKLEKINIIIKSLLG